MSRGSSRRDGRPWAERKWATISAAHAKRVELLQILSPDRRCADCGTRKRSYDALEIDHVEGRDWDPRKLNRWSRIARYWREFKAGVKLRALCRKCNGKDGRARQLQAQYIERAYIRHCEAERARQEAA